MIPFLGLREPGNRADVRLKSASSTLGAKVTLAGHNRRHSFSGVRDGVFIETWEVIVDF